MVYIRSDLYVYLVKYHRSCWHMIIGEDFDYGTKYYNTYRTPALKKCTTNYLSSYYIYSILYHIVY